MRLKRLELQGYKTFATKTEFTFEDGITAIVGPNGSGKSNIADAIRWVLGERSYSALRAKRTEDMIFWGSERRSRQGMAQASITLDNNDGELPVDYSEITISRRAYRSGENEYLLNGRRVRLKNITELLSKGGLGRRTYNVIGQGLVDAILSLRPDERRAILEEAAGISIHQAKRTETINKLEQTRENILRVNDLINEIAPRLTRLERQSERAQHYQGLSQQLEEALLIWYAHRWQVAQTALKQAEAQAAERQELSQEREDELGELELRKAELRAQQGRLRQKLSDWHLMENDMQAQSEEKKRELAVSAERLRLLNQQSEDIAQEIASLEANRLAQLERVAEAQEELGRAKAQLQERLIHLPETQGQLQARKRERQAAQEKLTKVQDRAFQLATEAADRRNRLTQLSERREELGHEVEGHHKALAEHQAKMIALREQIEALKGELEAIGAEANSLTLQKREIEQESEASRECQAQLQDSLARIKQEETGLQARYDLLERMRHEESGYYAGADTVLQAARDGRLEGIVGPVASLIRVPAEFETAIESALGPHLHDIVVETLDDAGAAIQFLKRTRGGRATFLPLDRIMAAELPPLHPSPTGGNRSIAGTEGVIGSAVDLVEFEQRLARVGHYLLGSTIVVRDFETALRLLARNSPIGPLQIAALTGEVIGSHGAVTGGPTRGRGRGILAREREWRELPQHLAEAQELRSNFEKKCQAEEANQRLLLEKLATLEETEGEIKAREGAKLEELASQERQTDLLDQEMGWRQAIENQLKAETRALDEKEAQLTEELKGLKEEEAKTQQQILALKAQLDALSVEELEDRLAELRTAIAVAEQARENQSTVLQDLKAGLTRSDEQVSAKKEKKGLLAAEGMNLDKRIEDLRLGSKEMMHQVQAMAQLVEPTEAELAALESEQVEMETTESRLRPLLREYESLHGQAVLQVQRRQDELTSLLHQIENDLGPSATLRTGLADMETDDYAPLLSPSEEEQPPELEKQIEQLRAQIKHIGPVNPNAPAEYEEVMKRYRFLTDQAGDLEEAVEDLRQVIGELDELMERDFRETFEAVHKEFKKYFTSLFSGGAAELILTEPNDLMETGVDIVARPPGRREQRLALLSGGERALTAVALIFAILKISPTPFCFLDEVDATLDESNIGRFREALQELSERTQFIVITHNRGTVEAADTIYGISMGKDSISRVISLKLGTDAPGAEAPG